MAKNWLAEVRKYDPNPNKGVVAAIVRFCGTALRSRDGSLLAFADKAETDHVRESFLKGKLGLTDPDKTLDEGIAAVGTQMADDKNRVTAYYLLTKHFEKFGAFGYPNWTANVAATSAVAAAAASYYHGAGKTNRVYNIFSEEFSPGDDGDLVGAGFLAAVATFGALAFGMAVSGWLFQKDDAPVAALPPAAVEAPAEEAMPAADAAAAEIPDGAGVIAAEVEAKPMLTVYFDTGAAEVSPEFEAKAADLLAYLEANPEASVAISGFNDPSGDAELNAELSKNRAESVQAALVAQGVDEGRTDLVKPDDTTITEMTADEARRVEVTIVE
ncbi:DUF2853 family protein [Alterisphingorhabdus coralli]|uniref:DUF2853 family protein n=1 Tax=Alterisphingorhabdus coralli TaxID=3071408 RepID=A0AA97FB71_9SPHN|nr:DUF2853 family protein [Parasphingorhabdus sp. SCSIO 66989]WOE75865.1 DUF2853 family protein [Parasphingorhabdus sp. SCSIO 66989]